MSSIRQPDFSEVDGEMDLTADLHFLLTIVALHIFQLV